MSVERLFFGQKYVVFWAKHLISILGIRFGGSRDEILTLHITTPPNQVTLYFAKLNVGLCFVLRTCYHLEVVFSAVRMPQTL